jgi:hypothetical protein
MGKIVVGQQCLGVPDVQIAIGFGRKADNEVVVPMAGVKALELMDEVRHGDAPMMKTNSAYKAVVLGMIKLAVVVGTWCAWMKSSTVVPCKSI